MKQRYLEVTFRNGKPLAAYLYLPRPGAGRVAATRDAGRGLKIDLDPAGTPIGVEITAPSLVSVADVNAALAQFGAGAIDPAELAPLAA